MVDAWLVARDHRSLGPLTRTLWLLDAQKRQAAAEVTLPPPPPDARLVSAPLAGCAGRIGWLYAEYRVVVLIDARRHCLLQQVGSLVGFLVAISDFLQALAPRALPPTALLVALAGVVLWPLSLLPMLQSLWLPNALSIAAICAVAL